MKKEMNENVKKKGKPNFLSPLGCDFLCVRNNVLFIFVARCRTTPCA
jgi:hypothetical protein